MSVARAFLIAAGIFGMVACTASQPAPTSLDQLTTAGHVWSEETSKSLAAQGISGTASNPVVPLLFDTESNQLLVTTPASETYVVAYTDKLVFDREFGSLFVQSSGQIEQRPQSSTEKTVSVYNPYPPKTVSSSSLSAQAIRWAGVRQGSCFYPGLNTPFSCMFPLTNASPYVSSTGILAFRVDPYKDGYRGDGNNPCLHAILRYRTYGKLYGWLAWSTWKTQKLEFNPNVTKPDFCRANNVVGFPASTSRFEFGFNQAGWNMSRGTFSFTMDYQIK